MRNLGLVVVATGPFVLGPAHDSASSTSLLPTPHLSTGKARVDVDLQGYLSTCSGTIAGSHNSRVLMRVPKEEFDALLNQNDSYAGESGPRCLCKAKRNNSVRLLTLENLKVRRLLMRLLRAELGTS